MYFVYGMHDSPCCLVVLAEAHARHRREKAGTGGGNRTPHDKLLFIYIGVGPKNIPPICIRDRAFPRCFSGTKPTTYDAFLAGQFSHRGVVPQAPRAPLRLLVCLHAGNLNVRPTLACVFHSQTYIWVFFHVVEAGWERGGKRTALTNATTRNISCSRRSATRLFAAGVCCCAQARLGPCSIHLTYIQAQQNVFDFLYLCWYISSSVVLTIGIHT